MKKTFALLSLCSHQHIIQQPQLHFERNYTGNFYENSSTPLRPFPRTRTTSRIDLKSLQQAIDLAG
ncbi:MAG: hypothetical protein KDJ65_26310 [Anaerolineae bacterium]|nr:hypothetical protein [Anaerolineae bacterium]